jgi:transcriptional regulator with XRE-family HTH domain
VVAEVSGEVMVSFGKRVRELRVWRRLTLREAAALAGLSYGYWGEIERDEKTPENRRTLEAIAMGLRVAPFELTGQPAGAPSDAVDVAAHAGLVAIEAALERYELGVDPGVPVREWPLLAADLAELARLTHETSDYAAQGELAPALLGELHAAYVRVPDRRREVLVGLIQAYSSAMWTTKRLGGRGLPSLASRAVTRCAQQLEDPVWLGFAALLRGDATGHLDRDTHYRRSVQAAEELAPHTDDGQALQACGMLHLSAALAAGAKGEHDTSATHVEEAAALAGRMDTEVGRWASLWFGPTNVGIWRTSMALELGNHGQALHAAAAVRPELLPGTSRQAEFLCDYGRVLVADKKTREKGLRILIHAEHLAPQRVRRDVFVRTAVTTLLGKAMRDAGGRELRGLAHRLGVAPIG